MLKAQQALVAAAARAVPPTGSMKHSLLLARNAWIWAQIARDIQRTRQTEREADRLEKSASELSAELVRTRAAVEQAKARVGRSRKVLEQLEASGVASTGGKP